MNEICKTCFFMTFCSTIKLPFCNGEDYVRQDKEVE